MLLSLKQFTAIQPNVHVGDFLCLESTSKLN